VRRFDLRSAHLRLSGGDVGVLCTRASGGNQQQWRNLPAERLCAGFPSRSENLLNEYFLGDKPQTLGLPSVAYVARELNLSPGYFGDLIKKETGKTAQEYIQWKVIDVAKERIFDETKSVTQIAYDLGYKYPQHFIRVFKQHVGSTPSEYRMPGKN
jgi:AraC-like DNA-binding protein